MPLVFPPYITDTEFADTLSDLEIQGQSDAKLQKLLDRTTGLVEGKLSKRFIVPLIAADGSAYSNAPAFARNLITNLFLASLRRIIGWDHNRNMVVDSTQRFIDVHKTEQKEILDDLLDPSTETGFKLKAYAENSIGPIQTIGLARADNKPSLEDDPWVP